MPAPTIVEKLVEQFDRNKNYYLKDYNETQLRREFIDKLFGREGLGWDIDNKDGVAPQNREVIHEASIKVAGATKAPDYGFRLGKETKFYLETKKPAVNINTDSEPAYQIRRYGWSAKLPLSILTNFKEIAVYDCRIKPKSTDNASTARIELIPYTELYNRWDELAEIFSREAVWKGGFDQYAESTKKKRGTSEVDEEFLKEIEKWRGLLAKNIALRNPDLTVNELNFCVQRTIDRLLFLRMCEDRGSEEYEQLRRALEKEGNYRGLLELFQLADDRYNSGLFHFKKERGMVSEPDDLTPKIEIDAEVLKEIIFGLYYPKSPYQFSVLSAHTLGSVYEQFLGKVIRLTAGHRAVIEDKPEVKKAGGAYYTPKYIVNYIINNTVEKLIDKKTPKQISKLKVLDPACGSGSFLLGAYEKLLDCHLDWYSKHSPEKHQKEVFKGKNDDWCLTLEEKKRILKNNIYGVDIDSQAVEVAKLNLLLKLLEGEHFDPQKRLRGERVLPDLANNLKCGNSLIGPDFYFGQKTLLDENEARRINVFDWEKEFPFKFDAVIGNPPYVRIQRIGHKEADYVFKSYECPTSKTDLSLVFLEKSLRLCSENGLISFICTSQWLSTDYGKKLRGNLSDGRLLEIVDFGSLPVFKKANTYPAIFTLAPRPTVKKLAYKLIQNKNQLNLDEITKSSVKSIPIQNLSDEPWNLGKFDLISYLKEKNIPWEPLNKYGKAYIGALTGMDAAFVIKASKAKEEHLENELLFPYAYRGAEVKRYSEVKPKSVVIYPYTDGDNGSPCLVEEAELKKEYPNIYDYLLNYKENLKKRRDSRKLYASGKDWYRYLRPGSFQYIYPEKLIIKGIDNKSTVGLLDKNTIFNGANCPGLIFSKNHKYSLYYFLGVINSSVLSYFLRSVCPAKLGGYTRFNAKNISNVPIRIIDFSNSIEKQDHDKLVSLVSRMLELQKSLGKIKTSYEKNVIKRRIQSTDDEINHLVYELYGLSKKEIELVEESIK
ncbi:restriction endonuclease subunit M [Candidatus Micrarchaeota archaeon CG_4_10_14_0_2_um_filter_55_9]|nr:MAG: hypothetical protein AUJ15_02700 [Candidatus Micrarchaeota archaeon CG1_02_55_41]PIO02932.1 MAG: restriction endonuclease subunit M [Candidatus Micrarchaeota archaeon CG09_land_8_20_14_0_10_55_25]PIZ91992.1 MAG: restriction endonuclease subunit M [Candidatus Micrarchaeota archaeon CG_4_10_14_0_2_um_filter_55_9]